MVEQKKILKTEHVVKKDFKYTLGGLSFNWTLRVDIKQELKDAKEVAVQFIKDIEEELKNK